MKKNNTETKSAKIRNILTNSRNECSSIKHPQRYQTTYIYQEWNSTESVIVSQIKAQKCIYIVIKERKNKVVNKKIRPYLDTSCESIFTLNGYSYKRILK